MKTMRTIISGLVLVLCSAYSYAQKSNRFTLSKDKDYKIEMSIHNDTLRVDKFPTTLQCEQYLVGLKATFDLTDPVTKQTVLPINSRWINKSFVRVGEHAFVDLTHLEDGLYEVAIYTQKRGAEQFWNLTSPYDIILEVKNQVPSFANSYFGIENKAVIDRFPTDAAFLEKCLANEKQIKTQSAPVQKISKHILANVARKGDRTNRAIVHELMSWIVKNITLDVGTYYRKDLNVDKMIGQRRAVNEGVAMLAVSVLRASGVPAVFMPYKALSSNAAWWTISKRNNTVQQYLPVVFYDGAWHIYNPALDISSQIASKGVDMSLDYFSNRGRLQYNGKVKFLVENHINPFRPEKYAIEPMDASIVEGLDAKKHIVTSYCRRYAMALDIENKHVVVDHFPYTNSFKLWNVIWKTDQGHPYLFDDGCVYDTPKWDAGNWNKESYFLNVFDGNMEPVFGNKDIEVKRTKSGVEFGVTNNSFNNMKVLNEIKMTDKVKNLLLQSNDLYKANNKQVQRLANELTAGLSNDYQKMEAIHRWVSGNIYYDLDAYKTDKKRKTKNFFQSIKYYKANRVSSVLKYHRAVCSGYTFLSVSLLRAAGIPAIGMECKLHNNEDHIFVMAYYKDRWVLMDPTWDSTNKFEFGKNMYQKQTPTQMVYFDVTLPFISQSHKFTKALLNMKSSPLSYFNLDIHIPKRSK